MKKRRTYDGSWVNYKRSQALKEAREARKENPRLTWSSALKHGWAEIRRMGK